MIFFHGIFNELELPAYIYVDKRKSYIITYYKLENRTLKDYAILKYFIQLLGKRDKKV